MDDQLLSILQLFIAAGGLGAAIKIASTLSGMKSLLERAVMDIEDHEMRMRILERKQSKCRETCK